MAQMAGSDYELDPEELDELGFASDDGDSWFQGYQTGREEILASVAHHLGRYAPSSNTEAAVLAAIADLSGGPS